MVKSMTCLYNDTYVNHTGKSNGIASVKRSMMGTNSASGSSTGWPGPFTQILNTTNQYQLTSNATIGNNFSIPSNIIAYVNPGITLYVPNGVTINSGSTLYSLTIMKPYKSGTIWGGSISGQGSLLQGQCVSQNGPYNGPPPLSNC